MRSTTRSERTALAVLCGAALAVGAGGCGSGAPRQAPVATSALLPANGGHAAVAPAARGRRPNIVFVLTDDLSTDLLRYMPHVRALARRGTTFSRYIVSDSLCCPSRASIFTGMLPHDTRVFTNSAPNGGISAYRRHGDERLSFASVLARRGYRTALLGKYLNGYRASDGGIPPGWTDWSATAKAYHGFRYTLDEDGRPRYFGSGPGSYLTTVLAAQADQIISQNRDPFLLEVATFAPHLPAIPAPRDRHRLPRVRAPRTGGFDVANRHAPGWLRRPLPLTAHQRHFIDRAHLRRVRSVLAVDRMVGRIEARLRATGQARSTYVVFSSDNGFHMGQHRLLPGKKTAFDSDVRVPLIISGPGVPAGRTVGALTQNIDLAPTFERLAGAGVPRRVDGRSLVPFLRGRHPRNWRTAGLVEHRRTRETAGDPDSQPVKAGNPPSYEALRFAHAAYVQGADGSHEYYDLRADPAELDNVYARLSPARRRRLTALVRRLRRCHGARTCAAHRP